MYDVQTSLKSSSTWWVPCMTALSAALHSPKVPTPQIHKPMNTHQICRLLTTNNCVTHGKLYCTKVAFIYYLVSTAKYIFTTEKKIRFQTKLVFVSNDETKAVTIIFLSYLLNAITRCRLYINTQQSFIFPPPPPSLHSIELNLRHFEMAYPPFFARLITISVIQLGKSKFARGNLIFIFFPAQ